MNREEIIRMAREAGWDAHHAEFDTRIERFAALVMSAECDRLTNFAIQAAEKAVDVAIALEREACAKVCDRYVNSSSDHEAGTAMNLQDAIRARGQA